MDPITISAIASAMASLGKLGFDIFNKPKNPAKSAEPYLKEARDLFSPYQQQGQEAYGQLNPIYSEMAQNPAGYLEKMMSTYEPSKAFQMKNENALQAAANTAAAGGMRGSTQDMTNQARLTNMLLGEDMQQWLQNMGGVQSQGLGGLGHFYDTGYGATSDIANILGSQGNLALLSQIAKNQGSQGLANSIFGGLGDIAGILGNLPSGTKSSSSPFIHTTVPSHIQNPFTVAPYRSGFGG